jgi:catechol 2,3-dioxygenase
MRASDNPAPAGAYIVDPKVRIGHVHLKVADLRRALDFYSGVLGLEIMQRYGEGAVFLSAGGYHHHIALNSGSVWEDRLRRRERPGCITRQLFIPRERR